MSTGRFRKFLDRIAASGAQEDGDTLPQEPAEEAATEIRYCQDRQVVRVIGVLRTVRMQPRAGTPALQAELFDGTDSLDVVWLGRRSIAGIEPGRRMSASGRIAMSHGRRVLFNPKYELRPTGQE
ncbi:OB-fold nucleic acid binding domain-containing protein [Streptomyces boninensis]|uniref:OB-fold nucleic acid binding domain-containing protein n=1 Tax=Streptomyces boninensis TaxID=2039455 RepID=UPI003B227467